MTQTAAPARTLGTANRDARHAIKEPATAQIASFVELFVWLLVLRGFFLPLFQIPTGSMAETLMGAYASHTCRNCGYEYPVGFHNDTSPVLIECPNCRWQETTVLHRSGVVKLNDKAGDRIIVHGWPFVFGGALGPQRWDVVVFRNPNDAQQNYIKRLVGLPGETIEIIDGDVWVTPPGESEPRPARKTRQAQSALWFSRYNHDYPPLRPSTDSTMNSDRGVRVRDPQWTYFKPRWTARDPGAGWGDLHSRVLAFDGENQSASPILFVTDAEGTRTPGQITDVYGYNGYYFHQGRLPNGDPIGVLEREWNPATDVRLVADVELVAGTGFVELGISKHNDRFFATLHADGRLTLEHENRNQPGRESWGETHVESMGKPVTLAIGHADYQVIVEVDSRAKITSSAARYPITQKLARERAALGLRPEITFTAERVRATLSHLRIDRDVHYTSKVDTQTPHPPQAVDGHPLTLRSDAYMVCGDNSTQSQDSRFWLPPPPSSGPAHPRFPYLGGHLHERYRQGVYDIGTVPADQMIGQAFLVYWPGFMPVFPGNTRIPDFMIDFGRIRWIH